MTNSQPSVVCGIDGSEESVSATEVARELATALDRRLVLAHAVPEPTSFPYGDAVARERRRRAALRDGWVDRRAAAHHAEARVVLGDVVEALRTVCREERAEFLVLGSRGRLGLAAAVLGSVSAELAVSSECPVIVVPAGAAERFMTRSKPGGHILCGGDGSLDAERALQVAARIAPELGLELRPHHIDTADPVDVLGGRAMESGARLIVIGSEGRRGMREAVLGSFAARVAATAPVPVVIVPRTASLFLSKTDVEGHDSHAAASVLTAA